jgi:hypothetical protein
MIDKEDFKRAAGIIPTEMSMEVWLTRHFIQSTFHTFSQLGQVSLSNGRGQGSQYQAKVCIDGLLWFHRITLRLVWILPFTR